MVAPANIFVVNAGSSSVKYQVISLPDETVIVQGQRDRIGLPDGEFGDHARALTDILKSLPETVSIDAVGHRVVHGGSVFREPVLIDQSAIDTIDELSTLAPLHNPANLQGIQAAKAALPGVPQVAVFDTAFFATLSEAAYSYAIPRDVAAKAGIRKYGFHGTSHHYVTGELERLSTRPVADRRVVAFHLGNGSSVSAVRGGVAIDTSMGFTPLAGLVMGTRSGDIDPAIPLYLQSEVGMSSSQVDDLLNRESGLLGLSGQSDMRDVFAMAEAGDESAQNALDVWVWRARHYLGAYIAHLGGLDAIVFTGGIGENHAVLRACITEGLEQLGIRLDANANTTASQQPRCVSAKDSSVEVWVIPTDEELQIARLTYAVVNGQR